jgi:hypothetical protein
MGVKVVLMGGLKAMTGTRLEKRRHYRQFWQYGDDGDLGFAVEEEAAHATSRSVRQRGRGGRAGGQRGASFTPRSAGRPTSKGKNFQTEEEVRLTHSVLAISQDPIVGNQQKSSAFWDRIHEHFKLHRPGIDHTARSLDSK